MSVLGDAIAFLTDGANWSGRRGILAYGQAHLWISVVATAMAAAIAVPPAVFLAHKRRWPVLAVAVVLASLGTVWTVIDAGHSGADSVWSELDEGSG